MQENTIHIKEKIGRIKLADRKLPDYTKGEEIFNMVSHIVGGGISIIMFALCLVMAIKHHNVWGIISGSIYGFFIILLYTMSSIYHGLKMGSTAKKVFQILDHCAVYLLIVGTYTPILLTKLREEYPILSLCVFIGLYALMAIAITLTAIDLRKYRVFSMIVYIATGWLSLLAVPQIIKCYSIGFLVLLVCGGIVYTLGAILYGLGSKGNHRYFHSVFHLFVIAGSVLHGIAIILYCM